MCRGSSLRQPPTALSDCAGVRGDAADGGGERSDEAKARHNLAKHGLSFEDAPLVFDGPTVTLEDNRFDYGEQRFITLGVLAGRVVVVAHTAHGDDATRIISTRKANRREQEV